MEIAEIVVEHIWRWVQRTQGAVEGKRIVGKFHAHALAGDNLHTVACKDVVFDFVDAGFERFFSKFADCLRLLAAKGKAGWHNFGGNWGTDVFKTFARAFIAVGLRRIGINNQVDFAT